MKPEEEEQAIWYLLLQELSVRWSSILSNLEDNRIDLYFINSNEVNAFVTAGQRIFINTELIIQSKTYAEYLGVLAHELAHINAGHISRTKNQITELTEKSMKFHIFGVCVFHYVCFCVKKVIKYSI